MRGSTSPTRTLTSLRVNPEDWKPEIEPIREFYAKFGDKLPRGLTRQLDLLEERLNGG